MLNRGSQPGGSDDAYDRCRTHTKKNQILLHCTNVCVAETPHEGHGDPFAIDGSTPLKEKKKKKLKEGIVTGQRHFSTNSKPKKKKKSRGACTCLGPDPALAEFSDM